MRAVRVFVEACGVVGVDNPYEHTEFATDINGTDDEIREYYRIGKVFNIGMWVDADGVEHEDNLMRVTKIELL